MHTHHYLRNAVLIIGAAAAAVVYTVIVDTRNNHIDHPPIVYPKWMSNADGRWNEEAHRPQ